MALSKYVNYLKGLENPADESISEVYFILELMKIQSGDSSDIIDSLITKATADSDNAALSVLNEAKAAAELTGSSSSTGNSATDEQTADTIVKRDDDGATSLASKSGITSERPTVTVAGYLFFDTSLGQPIWWDGSQWVDATGTTA